MISLAQLWLPAVIAAVLIFAASSIVHMVLKWHNAEYRSFRDEDAVRAAIRTAGADPGQYVVPHVVDMKAMKDPAVQRKFVDGPFAFVTLRPNGPINMGKPLALWFLYTLAVSLVAGYVAAKSLGAGATPVQVFRVTALLPLLAYVGGSIQHGIWMGKPWSGVGKEVVDGAIYACITGGVFAWLWPR